MGQRLGELQLEIFNINDVAPEMCFHIPTAEHPMNTLGFTFAEFTDSTRILVVFTRLSIKAFLKSAVHLKIMQD